MSSNDEANYNPMRKLYELITNVNLNETRDEAFVECLREEIKTLKEKTKELDKTTADLEKENESLTNTLKVLREINKSNLASLHLKQKMRTNMQQLVDATRKDKEMWKKRCDETLKKMTQEVEEARKVAESLTPRYAEYKKSQEILFLDEIRLKMLEDEIKEKKEEEKLRKEVDRILFNAKIVKFAEKAVAYYKRNAKVKGPPADHENQVGPVESTTAKTDLELPQRKTDSNKEDASRSVLFDEISRQIKESKARWLEENMDPKKLPSLKRTLSVDETPNKKLNVVSVEEIKTSAPPPPVSSAQLLVPPPFIEPSTRTTTELPMSGTKSVFFEKPVASVVELDANNSAPLTDDDRPSMSFSFNENQYAEVMSPPQSVNSSMLSTRETAPEENIPTQFSFNIQDPIQPNNQPMSFFSNSYGNFNMFS